MKGYTPRGVLPALIMGLAGLLLFAAAASAQQDVPRMTKEELKSIMGKAGVVIFDVRSEHDWKDAESMIQGAVREDPLKTAEWIEKYGKEKTLVFY
jgi:hypothetical protein